MFKRLRQYKEEHGGNSSTIVPEPNDDPELAAWVRDQRRQYKVLSEENDSDTDEGTVQQQRQQSNRSRTCPQQKRRKKNERKKGGNEYPLTPARVRELERIGFTWDMSHDVEWKKRFEELCEYQERHGDCIVPARYSKNPELGRWVMTQRRQHVLLKKGRPHRMTKERKQLLDDIGFKWLLRKGKSNKIELVT